VSWCDTIMIKSFKCKATQKIFYRQKIDKFPAEILPTSLRKLWMIDSALSINDLRSPPANHLEKLRGNRFGQFSIRINKKWRICFEWDRGNAYDVEITNYH